MHKIMLSMTFLTLFYDFHYKYFLILVFLTNP